ncbi:hypothetical protein CLOSTASPAR_02675 [[Clostridium] asparagiforme DSM 15981]|uniref:Uncharacterized protein n=1 Tax=[Clostridium] asparagiforme DSM 15981 TaxID=518636 RepID=C0D093_9FIRM|nr:hypothetical protein CLOSTASPAR_02675 [[Clostridium] asparagiforme DSM 15981]
MPVVHIIHNTAAFLQGKFNLKAGLPLFYGQGGTFYNHIL